MRFADETNDNGALLDRFLRVFYLEYSTLWRASTQELAWLQQHIQRNSIGL